MKILPFILAMVLFGLLAFGQDVVPGRTQTVEWDPVTVSSGTVEYEVSIENLNDASVVVLARASDTFATVDIPDGNWKIGVTSIRIAPDSTEVLSMVNWSDVDDPPGSTPNPFVVQSWEAPDPVAGLRLR